MSDRTFRIGMIAVGSLFFVGLLGYSVFGAGGRVPLRERTATTRTRAPRVMYHDDNVDVYQRRSVRSMGRRGGGIRAGK